MKAAWRNYGLPMLVLAAIGFACYANSFANQFVWDDVIQVENNRFLRYWGFLPRFITTDMSQAFTGTNQSIPIYRPLWFISMLVNFQIWGPNPFGFHLTSTVLHIATAFVLFLLMRDLEITFKWALVVAALFVSHPVHTESVTFISSVGTLWCVLGMLVALLLVRRYVVGATGIFSWLPVAAAGACAVAVMAKEIAVTFPGAVMGIGLVVSIEDRSRRRRWLIAVVVATSVVVAYLVARHFVLPVSLYERPDPLGLRCALILRSMAGHVGMTVLPMNLHVERTLRVTGWFAPALTLAGAVILIGLLVMGAAFFHRDRRVVFGLVLFVTAFSITSNILPLNTSFTERWLYWPMTGLLIALAALMNTSRNKLALAVCWSVVLGFGILTFMQNRVWRDNGTLFQTAIIRGGDTERSRNFLGTYHNDLGHEVDAEQQFRRALQMNPKQLSSLINLAAIQFERGDKASAMQHMSRALSVEPGNPTALVAMATIQDACGTPDLAEKTFCMAATLPTAHSAKLALSSFYFRHNRLGEAETITRSVLTDDPLHAAAHNRLGTILYRTDRVGEAERQFQLALRYDRWMVDAYANLAAIAESRGELDRAQQLYQHALTLAPQNADLHYVLGAMLARHGRIAEARQSLDRALALEPDFAQARQLSKELASSPERR